MMLKEEKKKNPKKRASNKVIEEVVEGDEKSRSPFSSITSSMLTMLSHQKEIVGKKRRRVPKFGNFKRYQCDNVEDQQSQREGGPSR